MNTSARLLLVVSGLLMVGWLFLGLRVGDHVGGTFPRENSAAKADAASSSGVAEAATVIVVDVDRWESLARAAKVFPVVCFNLTNSRSGTARVDSILDVREGETGVDGRWQRHWLVRTDMPYPLVRIVDTVQGDPVTGAESVVHRVSMVADHVIVSFPRGEVPAALGAGGLQLLERLGATAFYLVGFSAPDAEALPNMLARLRASGAQYDSADADHINYTFDMPDESPTVVELGCEGISDFGPIVSGDPVPVFGLPNDGGFVNLWGMRNVGGTAGFVAGMDINAADAWDVRTDASSVIIGVIDTGIRTTHQDLAANIWMNPGESGIATNGSNKMTNGVDDDGNGYVDDVYGINALTNTGLNSGTVNDDHGHGTHCSGTVGGNGNNGVGVAGVCWRTQLMVLKFMNSQGSGYDSGAIKCLAYARAKGAKVTTNSWGGSGYNSALLTSIQQARDADVIFIAAAGNNNSNNDDGPIYPASYPVENVVTVASMNSDGARSSFSNYGASMVDVAAPGGNIYSCSHVNDVSYTWKSGTSMAAPHVAGICALVRAQMPSGNYAETLNRLLATVDATSGWSGVVGRGGRVNAFRAIAEVLPQISQNATVATASRGGSVTLSVSAVDPMSGVLSYQWRRAGVVIPGATNATYTITNLQQNKTGFHDCFVTNASGTIVSGAIAVTLRHGSDFDGNGTPDVVWSDVRSGARLIWLMNGSSRLNNQTVNLGTVPADWVISAAADFDGNGKPDILWTQASTGRRLIWLMNGTTRLNNQTVEVGTIPADWSVSAVADFDGNNSPDLLWAQASTGRRLVWLMNGTGRLNNQTVDLGVVARDWGISGSADFDGNGSPDILWTQAGTGRRLIWLMNGTARLNNRTVDLGTIPPDWGISALADLDGNGWADIIWTQASTGRRLFWLMNGTARLSNQSLDLGTVATSWSICNR